tara:strand:- start:433 stop:591 length:159 start_codon:yes stop_codon:yes gene_type:complete
MVLRSTVWVICLDGISYNQVEFGELSREPDFWKLPAEVISLESSIGGIDETK